MPVLISLPYEVKRITPAGFWLRGLFDSAQNGRIFWASWCNKMPTVPQPPPPPASHSRENNNLILFSCSKPCHVPSVWDAVDCSCAQKLVVCCLASIIQTCAQAVPWMCSLRVCKMYITPKKYWCCDTPKKPWFKVYKYMKVNHNNNYQILLFLQCLSCLGNWKTQANWHTLCSLMLQGQHGRAVAIYSHAHVLSWVLQVSVWGARWLFECCDDFSCCFSVTGKTSHVSVFNTISKQ